MTEALQFINNRAFNQAFVGFSRGRVGELRISDEKLREYLETQYIAYEETFNNQGELQFQRAHPELNMIIRAMSEDSQFSNWVGENTIIVIANRNKAAAGNERTMGYNLVDAEKKYYYNVIFSNSSNDYTTYVHELGHLLGLLHPFRENTPDDARKTQPLIPRGSSQNFMDYTRNPNMFWRWQWENLMDFFNNPE
jgi:hypothetical protein